MTNFLKSLPTKILKDGNGNVQVQRQILKIKGAILEDDPVNQETVLDFGATSTSTLSDILTNGNNANGSTITGMGDPVFSKDAVTKSYLESAIESAIADIPTEVPNLSSLPDVNSNTTDGYYLRANGTTWDERPFNNDVLTAVSPLFSPEVTYTVSIASGTYPDKILAFSLDNTSCVYSVKVFNSITNKYSLFNIVNNGNNTFSLLNDVTEYVSTNYNCTNSCYLYIAIESGAFNFYVYKGSSAQSFTFNIVKTFRVLEAYSTSFSSISVGSDYQQIYSLSSAIAERKLISIKIAKNNKWNVFNFNMYNTGSALNICTVDGTDEYSTNDIITYLANGITLKISVYSTTEIRIYALQSTAIYAAGISVGEL